jgi:hypothetical protein
MSRRTNGAWRHLRHAGFLTVGALTAGFGCSTIQGANVVEDPTGEQSAPLVGSNLAGNNLAGTNLAGNNLAGTNLAGANLGGNNLAGNNLAGSNLAGTNLAGNNLAGSNLAGSNLAGNNLAGTNLAGSNLAGTDSGYNIHGVSGAMGMLYSGEDVWKPTASPFDGSNRAECVVMGIGSTAFPKLLSQQSANAKISVAVGKLPWGFASTSGGALSLNAWEAIVWGDKTYCSFVVAVPPRTAWSGVAGFIKGIFRWNAPPTQSMDISGIERSAAIDPTVNLSITTYTGMMNAAAAFVAGTVPAKAFIAGELGLVTATTNNQSVSVDFSSWVQDKNQNGLVLGNVQSFPLPTYAESVYAVRDNGDGTVGVILDDAALLARTAMPSGMTDSTTDLENAYTTWSSSPKSAPKPIPRRCGASLDLVAKHSEPSYLGKCDSGLVWAGGSCMSGSETYQNYSTLTGKATTAPMNTYMMTTKNGGAYARANDGTCNVKPILSETYVHMFAPSYDLNRAFGGTITSTGTACSSSQDQTKAFDNLIAAANGTNWCVTSTTASLMYKFPQAYAITSYAVVSGADSSTRDPRDWVLQGCNSCKVDSDTGWTTIDTRAGQVFANRYQSNAYAFSNTTPYSQVRMKITANNTDSGHVEVGELQLFDSNSCTASTDAAICSSYGKNCGSITITDNCGATRTISNCGTCSSGTCAGGGVANVCGSGSTLTCPVAYSPANCMAYVEEQSQVSSGGHNYLCANANCRMCAVDARCAPGGTGCPWGVAWQDNGPCSGGGSGPPNGGACYQKYAQSSCLTYLLGSTISSGGHNWQCTNGNCSHCADYESCEPSDTGCPWGTVWSDLGKCH